MATLAGLPPLRVVRVVWGFELIFSLSLLLLTWLVFVDLLSFAAVAVFLPLLLLAGAALVSISSSSSFSWGSSSFSDDAPRFNFAAVSTTGSTFSLVFALNLLPARRVFGFSSASTTADFWLLSFVFELRVVSFYSCYSIMYVFKNIATLFVSLFVPR